MYHPEVVERRIRAVEKSTGLKLRRYSVEESGERQALLDQLYDPKTEKAVRDLTRDENDFAINESLLSTCDFRYWADRYAFLNSPTGELKRINFGSPRKSPWGTSPRGSWRPGRTGATTSGTGSKRVNWAQLRCLRHS